MTIQITKVQLFLLMFVMQTGLIYISFQNLVIEHANRDAMIQFIIVAIIYFLQLLFFERMHQYFTLKSFTKMIYIIYWFLYILIFIISLTYVLEIWIFPNTPPYIVIAMLLFICFYASISRPETAVNIGVILIPMLFLFLIFMFLTVPDLQVKNLLPLFYDRQNTWWKGFIFCTYAFTGAEIYVVLRKYLINEKRISKKVLTFYFSILTTFYMISITFTLMFFSLDELKLIPEPILYILHSIEVTFVKRLDIFFVYIWLSWSLIAIINYVLILRLVYFEKKVSSPKIKLLIFFTVIGVIANFLVKFSVLEFLKNYFVYVNILFSLLLPVIIILINKLRGRTVSNSEPPLS